MLFKIPKRDDSLFHFGEAAHKHHGAEHLNLLVWNIYKGKMGPQWREDFRGLAADKDLIFVQEALFPEHKEFFESQMPGWHWSFAPSFQYRFSLRSTGVVMGSRIHPHSFDFHRHSEKEFLVGTPKMTLHHRYLLGESHTFSVVNTHSVNFTSHQNYFSQWQSVEKFFHLEKSGPLIVAGDFNTWNTTRWLYLLNFLGQHGLEPVILDDDPRVLKLDHVFFRHCTVEKASIRKEIRSSDHWPMEVRLRLTDRL